MLSNNLKELPHNRAILLDNTTCPYCGIEINEDNDSKEHVIGRRFVPKGLFDGGWNLIVRACKKCNSKKSDLENDISAITLACLIWFDESNTEEPIRKEVKRKAEKSISRRTKRKVADSHEIVNCPVPLAPGVELNFDFVSPPQIDNNRLFELARMQMMAFFYFITFNSKTQKGGFWPEGFHPLSAAPHRDWGNILHKEFMNFVVNWEPKWAGSAADGFFKSIIRRHPNEECWAWALEWNNSYRLIGFFGKRDIAQKIVDSFSIQKKIKIPTDGSLSILCQLEVELLEEEDKLFIWNSKSA